MTTIKHTTKTNQPSANSEAEWNRRMFDFVNILKVFDLTEEDLAKQKTTQPPTETKSQTTTNHDNQE
jgi:hypothetical protein